MTQNDVISNAVMTSKFASLTIGMMEQWNIGFFLYRIEKNMIYEIHPSWIEKTSIEVLKKLRVWQDAISLYVLAYKIFMEKQ
jgi:hypothetical protein